MTPLKSITNDVYSTPIEELIRLTNLLEHIFISISQKKQYIVTQAFRDCGILYFDDVTLFWSIKNDEELTTKASSLCR